MNRLYYKFRVVDGWEEFHVAADRREVVRNDALSKACRTDSPTHEAWKAECMAEIKTYNMALVPSGKGERMK